MADTPQPLSPADLYRATAPDALGFTTTADLEVGADIIGQDRAVRAVDFGVGIRSQGYNVFALGPSGTGKASIATEFLRREAERLPKPDDWVYVNNFDQPHKPHAIRLEPGGGCRLRDDLETLVDELQAAIGAAFESEEYEKQRREIAQGVSSRQEERLDALKDKAEERGYLMVRTPAGLAFVPKNEEGEALSRDAYNELPEEEQGRIDDGMSELNEELQEVMRQVRQEEKAGRDEMRELDKKVTDYAARHLVEETKEAWQDVDEVQAFLDHVLEDVVENADDFRSSDEDGAPGFMGMMMSGRPKGEAAFRRYRVNVLVGNSDSSGAPLVTESNPTLQNLVGRVEHLAQFGALVTDFNMIKPGALHTANGGFLLLEARELLLKPYAWDGLKRSLKTREVRIEDVATQLGFATAATLDPEPIPLEAKIVLSGEPFLYYLLHSLDPDFSELFKVKADFETETERTEEAERLYARFVAGLAEREDLPAFDAPAVARVVEHASRLVSDQRKLSTRFLEVGDLVREAAYWALRREGRDERSVEGGAGSPPEATGEVVVREGDVSRAIDERIYRSNRVEERIRELIADGTILIETEGSAVGQVNGLSVIGLGDYAFGRPSRISATHALGDGDVIDIEREVEMGGPIHSKGVMILSGFLASRYGGERPLSLSIRLVFEQSYGGVEGDSASSAELYAVLSSLSGLPLRQDVAVTGSVDQHGRVQAIGGVNEKIEGFYEVCLAKGLTGTQTVLIPAANVPHLMLKEDVRGAVDEGRFAIIPVETIDQGIELLTGVPAGAPDEEGRYPEGSVNGRIAERVERLARLSREQRNPPASGAEDGEEDGEPDGDGDGTGNGGSAHPGPGTL